MKDNVRKDAELDDDQPHLTFDEFVVPINLLTDDEDDELQEARQRVRNCWSRNSSKVVSDEIKEQVPNGKHEEVDDEDEI
ncbi:conserved hypothetical protein [Ricinus communis]|uniref:Uncharacterized protein n=1 Tax=Ricinus communis TaxID=3988 RepID=B9RL75_RICCO|nr:conserved hypothetical protein [Ricinus communis]